MIAFGVAIGDEDNFRRYALPGLRRALEPGAELLTVRGERRSIFAAYNRLLDAASGIAALEGLVILHEDVEILSPYFTTSLRRALVDQDVGIVGAAGTRGVRGMDWWQADEAVGAVIWDVIDPALAFGVKGVDRVAPIGPGGGGEVDAVDGLILCFSRRAVRELRFDSALGPGFHGYDTDICLQARERGMKVMVAPLGVTHYNSFPFTAAYDEAWRQAYVRFQRKWEGRMGIESPATRPTVPRLTELSGRGGS